ncbi:MAG: SDR family oxidoreductase [Betaproteobacteria bacterium]|nr:SDR family oxidoreductase [Betaproteobacteria bacterium]
MNPTGAVAIVTGAGGHLGRGIAAGLFEAGCKVFGWDVLPSGDDAVKSIRQVDVADPVQVDEAIAALKQEVDQVDILINAAGKIASAPLLNLLDRADPRHPLPLWDDALRANLTSTFVASRAVAAWMAARRTKGVIVNISSIAAQGNAGQSVYAAAKAGVESLTVTWAKELGALGIRVVAVAPGFIDTPSTHGALSSARIEDVVQRTPLRRLGSTESVVDAVLHAVRNDFLTGTTIRLDGGLRI